MNVQRSINKLLLALNLKGKEVKINHFGFWTEKDCAKRYSYKYIVYIKEPITIFNREKSEEETIMKYVLKKEFYNKMELLKYLAQEYRKLGSEANG